MKTTFDLPEPLLRRAKAAAALNGRSLRDLVADALAAKLAADEQAARAAAPDTSEWDAFKARLVLQPDGSYINPDGIDNDNIFFKTLESLRSERLARPFRDPLTESAPLPPEPVPSRRKKPRD